MNKKLKISFTVETWAEGGEIINFEYYLKDLLETSTLPALSAQLVPLTMTVTKKRG